MRRRLLISMLAVAIVAVLALGIPLGFVLGRLQVDEANQTLHRDASTLANQLQDHYSEAAGLPVPAGQLAKGLTDRYVVIWQNGHVAARTGLPPPRPSFRSATVTTSNFKVYVAAADAALSGDVAEELLLVGVVAQGKKKRMRQ